MSNQWWDVLMYGGIAGAATFAGMLLILVREAWSRRHSATLVSYSAGVLLGVGFLHVLPEAVELTPHAPGFILLAFILFYFLEHHLLVHAGHEEQHHVQLKVDDCHDGCCSHPHPMGMVAFFGMALHSSIDGMIIGTGFEVSHELGLLAALGVIAHEVPEGIAMLAIMLHYGWPRRKAIQLTSFVALATPAAALASFAVVRDLDPQLLGALLAMAGGSFVYIAASDLIPESHRSRGLPASIALVAGILTAVLAGLATHGH
jgi:ZIP family zinc transporter/zinc and cadmium transporter